MRQQKAHGSIVRGEVGTRITDGFDPLLLEGAEDATIVSVTSVGGEDALEYLGAKLAGPERTLAAWAQLRDFPPTKKALGPIVDAEGAVIKPYTETRKELGYELLLGYEVIDDSQQSARTHFEVVYRVDDQEFLYVSPAQLVYCPESMESEACFEEVDDD